MDANHVKDTAVDPPKTPLPEPDNDNITVLTSKLPNEPILPWNRYDSPWLQSESPELVQPEGAEAAAGTEGSEEPAAAVVWEEEALAARSSTAESPAPASPDSSAAAISPQTEAPSPAGMSGPMPPPLEAEVPTEVQNPQGPTQGPTEVLTQQVPTQGPMQATPDEVTPDEATPDEAVVPPIPTAGHYLIDLAFEGTTD